MKNFLRRAVCLAFLFFLSLEFYIILDCTALKIFSIHYSDFIHISAGIVSLILLTTSAISLCKKYKTFDDNTHKINKIN